MPSPGDSLRSVWTAQFANDLLALLGRGNKITGAGRLTVSPGRGGTQLVVPDPPTPVSTLQGILTGGDAPGCTDGTVVLDLFAWNAYSIQGGAFITSAGSTTISVQVNGVPISWLDAIAVDVTGPVIKIPVPPPDLTHVVPPGAQLSIVISGSSGDCAGLAFSLNVPF